MSLLNAEQRQRVAAAISEAEKGTDAELVAVLARRADDYLYIPTLWAAALALLTPLVLKLTPMWFSDNELLFAQWVVFIVLVPVLRIPAVLTRIVPKRVARWRASNLARRQFLENNLHHTQGDTGVLIFVAETEHYVEIIADRGIDRFVSAERWQEIVDAFTARVRAKQSLPGFLECIATIGELLQHHVPATHERNELPDRLIVLD